MLPQGLRWDGSRLRQARVDNPAASPLLARSLRGAVAQLVERLVRNEEVRGSTPLGSTRVFNGLALAGLANGALGYHRATGLIDLAAHSIRDGMEMTACGRRHSLRSDVSAGHPAPHVSNRHWWNSQGALEGLTEEAPRPRQSGAIIPFANLPRAWLSVIEVSLP